MVGIHNIIELNQIIKQKNLAYKIHISDACGGASMRIKELSDGEKNFENLINIIDNYFASNRIKLEYSNDKMVFWTI